MAVSEKGNAPNDIIWPVSEKGNTTPSLYRSIAEKCKAIFILKYRFSNESAYKLYKG
jgi:hypothetical protein